MLIGPFCLFLYHLYKKKPPIKNETPSKDPIIAIIITSLLSDDCWDGEIIEVDDGVDVDGGSDGALGGNDDDGGGSGDGDSVGTDDVDDGCGVGDEGSKIFVHIYALLLLISSNKISLSVDWL